MKEKEYIKCLRHYSCAYIFDALLQLEYKKVFKIHQIFAILKVIASTIIKRTQILSYFMAKMKIIILITILAFIGCVLGMYSLKIVSFSKISYN